VTLRRVDSRFLLPRPIRSAVVAPELDAWQSGLREAGVDVLARDTEVRAELAVGTTKSADETISVGAPSAIVEGRRGARALGAAYPSLARFLPIPTIEAPELVLPLAFPRAAAYAIANWTLPSSWYRRVRNRILLFLLERGSVPDVRPAVAVGASEGGPPFVVVAARDAGVGLRADGEWFLTLGHGDALTRGVFHVFPPGESEPRWVVKFVRVRGYGEPFDRDERGLTLAREAGAAVGDHAPRLLARFEVDGLHASVETAAVGTRMTNLLRGRRDRTEKLRAIEAVAAWLVTLGAETKTTTERLAPELARLRADVLPRWATAGVPASLAEELPPLRAVLQHNDPGSWNIIVNGSSFTAVDWESARREGLPLWDLAYFLVDALIELDAPSDRDAYAARLFRGEVESSRILRRWLRRGADAAEVPPDAIGAVVTLGWLHHGLSHVRREAEAERRAPGLGAEETYAERIARIWTSDPALSPRWEAWRP
jgi:hypothetical protein